MAFLAGSFVFGGCGSRKERPVPNSGDAVPVPVFQLSDWCKSTDITEEAQKTLNAMIRSMSAADCAEFEYRYSRLELRKLSLSFENLTDPGPILSLIDLQELSIRGNDFSGLNWTRNLEQLLVLDASQNPLGQSSSELSLNELAPRLTELMLDNTGVTRVYGSEHSPLETLSLSQNNLVDIQFLKTLSGLTSLTAETNNIARIEVLATLPGLKILNLSGNQIANLDVLSGLVTLKELSLADHADQLELAKTWLPVGIEVLRLGRSVEPISAIDISGINDFPKLRSLVLDGRLVGGEFGTFPGLIDFSVEGGRLNDPKMLSRLTGLHALNLKHCGLVSFPDLSALINMSLLVADRNQFPAVDGKFLPARLRSLTLDFAGVRILTNMVNLDQLVVLSLKGNGIESVDEFSWPLNLNTLDLSSNKIARLQSLETLTNLLNLHLARNRISNPAPLAVLTGLGWLDLSGNQLDTIAPLSVLTKLNMLDIRSNGLPASVKCPLLSPSACLF